MKVSTSLFAILFILLHTQLTHAQQSTVQVLHYDIKAELFPKEHKLIALAEMRLKNAGQTSIDHIELNLKYDKIYWIRDGEQREVEYHEADRTIHVPLSLSPSDSVTLSIKYEGIFFEFVSNRIEEENSWLLTESQWFPQPAGFDEEPTRFSYDLAVTAPEDQTAVASGKLVSVSQSDGKKTYHWSARHPLVQYISLSSARYEQKAHKLMGIPIQTYLTPQNKDGADTLVAMIAPILDFYIEQFGEYAFEDFKIVETNRRGGYGPPGMILLNGSLIRVSSDAFEQFTSHFVLAHEIAHQWWGSVVAQRMSLPGEQFLTEALASYCALLYLQKRMDLADLPISYSLPVFGLPMTLKYTAFEWSYMRDHKPVEYRPISEIKLGERDYRWTAYYKGMFFLRSLESFLGSETMRKGLREYLNTFRFSTGSLGDLRMTLEKAGGKDLGKFFHDWLNTTKRIDYAVTDVQQAEADSTGSRELGQTFRTRITVKNLGDFSLPVKVLARTKGGEQIPLWFDASGPSVMTRDVESAEEIASAVVDPDWALLDADRTNNFFPRKRRWTFLISSPPVTTQEYYYGPSATYGLTDGVRLGAWITSIYPITPLTKTCYPLEWRVAAFYGIKSSRPGFSTYWNSWYGMPSPHWSYGAMVEDVHGTQTYQLHGAYRWSEDHTIQLSLNRTWLYDISYYDPQDFERGRATSVSLHYQNYVLGMKFSSAFKLGIRGFDGEYDFRKVSVTISGWYPYLPRTSFRFFAGAVRGSFPSHEVLYLSGSVTPEGVAYWFVDPDRKISTQERLRVNGDANLRGFIGSHRKGRNAVALNSEFVAPQFSFFRAFVDIGSVWDSGPARFLWDAGVGIDFDVSRFDFPLFVSEPLPGKSKFDFRWSLEIKI